MSLTRLIGKLKSDDTSVAEVEKIAAKFDEAWDGFEPQPDAAGFAPVLKHGKELEKTIAKALKQVDDKAAIKAIESVQQEMASRLKAGAQMVKKGEDAQSAAQEKERQASSEEEAAEADDSKLADPKRTRALLKKLDKGAMEFAFAETASGQTVLALHKSKAGKGLAGDLKKDLDVAGLTFGSASAVDGVLTLDVQGKKLSALGQKVKKYLKDNKPMPFDQVKIVAGGKDVTDEGDKEAAGVAKDARSVLASYDRMLKTYRTRQGKKEFTELQTHLKALADSGQGKISATAGKLESTLGKILQDTELAAADAETLFKKIAGAGGPKAADAAEVEKKGSTFGRNYNTKLNPLVTKSAAWAKKASSGQDPGSAIEDDLASIKKLRSTFVANHKAMEKGYNDALDRLAQLERHSDPKVAQEAASQRKAFAGLNEQYLKAMKEFLSVVAELEKSGAPAESTDYHKAESHLSFVIDALKSSNTKLAAWAAKYPSN